MVDVVGRKDVGGGMMGKVGGGVPRQQQQQQQPPPAGVMPQAGFGRIGLPGKIRFYRI